MPVNQLLHNVNLSSNTDYYLNIPAVAGMSDGYWYFYSASAANNTTSTKIKPYRWGSVLDTNETSDVFTIEGSIVLVSESLNRQRIYHGSNIVRVGAGTNVQTGNSEEDAFFFYHLGDLNAGDNIGYWDYGYLTLGSTEWDYFQYHQHQPSVYEDFNNGRMSMAARDYINPADKRYGYMHNVGVSFRGTPYTNVLARVHQPSVGGAHNSHTDIILGQTPNKNYVLGGILAGTSNRFHAFYLSQNGTQWEVFNRNFNLASNVFTSETSLGTYNLAPPTYNPVSNTGTQDKFPLRASAGDVFGSRVYIPVIYSGSGATFDLKVWDFESADSLSDTGIVVTNLLTGSNQRPDCHILTAESKLHAVVSDTNNGGVKLFVLSGSSWVDEGSVVTNGTGDIIRIHGFDFNSADSRYYVLLSGEVTGSGTYTGPGVYSFSSGEPFFGYRHLSYITSSYGFEVKSPLSGGYVEYDKLQASFTFYTSSEPQSIAEQSFIMDYGQVDPLFYDRTDTKLGGNELYFGGVRLKDGRLVGIGAIEGNIGNRGGRDLLLAVYGSNPFSPGFYAYGGDKDDFFTGIIEDTERKELWMTGYTKSNLAQIRDIRVHAYGKGIFDEGNPEYFFEWRDVDIDGEGNQYYAGNLVDETQTFVGKYNYNLELVWKYLYKSGDGVNDTAYGISLDSDENMYVVGKTNGAGEGGFDAYVMKLDNTGSVSWAKSIGTAGDEYASSVSVVTKDSVEYVVVPIVSGSSTFVTVFDTTGSLVEQNQYDDFIVNRVRKSETETDGYFLLVGKNNQSPAVAKVAKGQVLSETTMLKWIETFSSGSLTSEGFDIRNTEALTGNGGLGSQTGPKYHMVGKEGVNGFITKFVVDEDLGAFQTSKVWGTNLTGSTLTSLTNTEYNAQPSSSRSTFVVGHSMISPEGEGMNDGIITSFDYDGTRRWTNSLGHMGQEYLYSVVPDVTGYNIISAGSSTSHANGQRTFLFRSDKSGYGTGNYHLDGFPGMSMWYKSSSLATHTNNATFTNVPTGSDVPSSLTTSSVNYTKVSVEDLSYVDENYSGGNVFDMFIAKVSLDELASHLNEDEHLEHESSRQNTAEYVDFLTFYQFGAAGDSVADDGNFFGYDILQMSGSGNIMIIGQTSGNIAKENTGTSGVYDYILTEFNPVTGEHEFYQNGSDLDEEVYNGTVINDGSGSIAFVGRTTGNLGVGTFPGNYQIFLAIYNPIDETFQYFQTGSGFSDRGVDIHDIGNNELAIVFETPDTITEDQTNKGGIDIGVIKFNYSTLQWDTTSYQTGTIEDEILTQEGKASTFLNDSRRIAIVGTTRGTIDVSGRSYDNNDIFIAILNLETGEWSNHQIGTAANEFGTVIFQNGGNVLLVGGYTDASFSEPDNGIFARFDAGISVRGRDKS